MEPTLLKILIYSHVVESAPSQSSPQLSFDCVKNKNKKICPHSKVAFVFIVMISAASPPGRLLRLKPR